MQIRLTIFITNFLKFLYVNDSFHHLTDQVFSVNNFFPDNPNL